MTLGQITRELEKYSFPDRAGLLKLLKNMTDSRNNLFHNLPKLDNENVQDLDGDMAGLRELGEELFFKMNTLYQGMQKVLASDVGEGSQNEGA